MKPSIFITGVTGFLGKNLLSEIDFSNYKTVICLSRKPVPVNIDIHSNVKFIIGDLKDVNSYSRYLDNIDTVVHLAALTGKEKKSEYYRINYKATSDLIGISEKKGVKNFLFVSTIAVKFRKKRGYHYAYSKELAENRLKKSSLNYLILRPTIILGKYSPVFSGFFRFAQMPVVPIFGTGNILIQPVDVKDLSRVIDLICEKDGFDNRTVEAGGKEKIKLLDFIRRIPVSGGKKKRVLKIPMFISLPLIWIADKFFYGLTPVTMGQLATFRNNGISGDENITEMFNVMETTMNQMMSVSIEGELEKIRIEEDKRECKVFCNYLIDSDPTPYVFKKYSQFLTRVDNEPRDAFDKFLFRFGKKSVFFTRLGDAFSRFFRPDSLLRKKLGFLFAILETSPVIYKKVDIIKENSLPVLLIKFAFKGTVFAFSLIVSLFVLMPFKIFKSSKKDQDLTEKSLK